MDPLVYLLIAVIIVAALGALFWKVRGDDIPSVR
jgi:hypothetical protein